MGVVVAFPLAPQQRLNLAVERLLAAQAEQRQAVRSFQDSMRLLRAETSRLGCSLKQLDSELSAVGSKVEEAREASRQLSDTAARM